MRAAALLLALAALAACQSGQGSAKANDERPASVPKVPPHEQYLRNVTRIRADQVFLILPEVYGDELRIEGLKTAWVEDEEAGTRSMTAKGEVMAYLLELTVKTRDLKVTLVKKQPEPEVMITAVGRASMAHSVAGIGQYVDDVRILHIRNDKRLR
jgi:hypothetical protein